MESLVILFWDGSIMRAETAPITFELPVIEAEVLDLDSNCERAILPLGGIRQMIVGGVRTAPPQPERHNWDRAAFHFSDGQVMRAWVGPDAVLGMYGGIWPVSEPGSDEQRVLAIPYSSLTAVYRLRSWDRRSGDLPLHRRNDDAGTVLQRVRVLAERELRAFGGEPGRRAGHLLGRLRGEGREPASTSVGDPGRRRR